MKIEVTTLQADKAEMVELDESVFGLEPRQDILHRMVTWQLAKRQRGMHKAKSRSEIAGTGRKMYRQKGTGHARHGDRKVNLFRGGGKAFGPVIRSHEISLPKKVRVLALKHALSSKARSEQLVVLDEARIETPKTGILRKALDKLGWRSALIVDGPEIDANFRTAARNIPNIDLLPSEGLNVYDILRKDKLVLTKAALGQLEARFK